MLTSVGSSASQLTPLPLGPEDAPQVCGARARKAPTATVAGAAANAPAAPASSTPAGAAAGASKTSGPKRAPPSTRPKAAASGYAKTKASPKSKATTKSASKSPSRTSAAKKAGPLAFLDDARLSVEEKLLRLLSYLNDKWNKELDQKMKEFKQVSTTASRSGAGASGASSSGLGGLVKKAVSYASVAIPQLGVTLAALKDPAVRGVVKNLAGPALAAAATAAGQPELAPLALRYGPDLVDAAASAASSVSGGATGATAGASSGTATKETAGGIGSDRNDQLKLMELQRILDQQKEMFSLVSNLLRTTHDTRMAVIQNVR